MGLTQLYRDYRHLGVRPRSLRTVLRVWWGLLIRTPLLVQSVGRRHAWIRAVAFNAGLARGSLVYRVRCL
jgi:hypothetical protein